MEEGKMSTEDEMRRLRGILEQDDLVPAAQLGISDQFGAAVKDAVVADVVRQFDPPPSGRLLSRLPLIVTDESKPLLAGAYLANLGSPDPAARRASINGLVSLGHPSTPDVALTALRDSDDGVVAAAVQALIPQASQDPSIRDLLGNLYAAHHDDPSFHLTRTLLDAHDIAPGEPK
jgi:hypothetical protein